MQQTEVAFQGERGVYSENAIYAYYDRANVRCQPYPKFKDVFEAVKQGKAQYGMLPIENVLAGSVHENYDLLLSYPKIMICGEEKIRIQHNLIGLPGTQIVRSVQV